MVDGWNVRKYNGNRQRDDLLEFAKGGYKKVKPENFVSGPFGPLGYVKGLLMDIGTVALDLYQKIVDMGVPPVVVGATMCVFGMLLSVTTVIVVAWVTTSREDRQKQD